MSATWRAVRTCANRERRVVRSFEARGMRAVCPLRRVATSGRLRQVPLFPRVVFVEMPAGSDDELALLEVPGVVELVPGEVLGGRELAALCRACREGRVATRCRPGRGRAQPGGWLRLEVAGMEPVWLRDDPAVTASRGG